MEFRSLLSCLEIYVALEKRMSKLCLFFSYVLANCTRFHLKNR